jgi:hypothetical protein
LSGSGPLGAQNWPTSHGPASPNMVPLPAVGAMCGGGTFTEPSGLLKLGLPATPPVPATD